LNNMRKIVKNIIIIFIRLYQTGISPLLQKTCRHTPSCSQYCIDAINKYGIYKGCGLGLKRILRCHPWGSQGYDPVP